MGIKIPEFIGKSGRKWIKEQLSIIEIKPEMQELLLQAAHCLTRVEEARKAIDSEGLYEIDRFGQKKPHPAVQVELANKREFQNYCKTLFAEATPKKQGKDELEEKGFGNV
jgi:hypothetical protein